MVDLKIPFASSDDLHAQIGSDSEAWVLQCLEYLSEISDDAPLKFTIMVFQDLMPFQKSFIEDLVEFTKKKHLPVENIRLINRYTELSDRLLSLEEAEGIAEPLYALIHAILTFNVSGEDPGEERDEDIQYHCALWIIKALSSIVRAQTHEKWGWSGDLTFSSRKQLFPVNGEPGTPIGKLDLGKVKGALSERARKKNTKEIFKILETFQRTV